MARVQVEANYVLIEELECRDPDAVAFFGDITESARGELACRALGMGVVGLQAMGVAGHVELVEREFLRLSQRFDAALVVVQGSLMERVAATLDPEQAESVSARLSSTIV